MKKTLRAAATVSATLTVLPPASATEIDFGSYADVIVCDVGNVLIVGYLHSIAKHGSAIYLSVDGQQGLKLSAEGVLEPGSTIKGGGSCAGRTPQDLASEGRAFFRLAR